MIPEKIRTNAIIAYFFLGWMMLLARNNPDFRDPFVRAHARAATKIHAGFAIAYLLYVYILQSFLYITIPILTITVDKVVMVGIFSFFVYLILRGPYLAYRGILPETIKNNTFGLSNLISGEASEIHGDTEQDRIMALLSFVPFIGYVVASRFPGRVTSMGERIGGMFALVIVIYSILAGDSSSSTFLLLFAYILFLSFILVGLVVHGTVSLPSICTRLWSMDEIHLLLRTLFIYTRDVGLAIIGRRDTLSFRNTLRSVVEYDRSRDAKMAEIFRDDRIIFPIWCIFIPVINLIFLPRLFSRLKTRYVLAIPQGLIITLLLFVVWWWLGFETRWQLVFLFPVSLGLAHVHTTPFYRVPIVYGIFSMFNFLTFGMLRRTQAFVTNHATNQSICYRTDDPVSDTDR